MSARGGRCCCCQCPGAYCSKCGGPVATSTPLTYSIALNIPIDNANCCIIFSCSGVQITSPSGNLVGTFTLTQDPGSFSVPQNPCLWTYDETVNGMGPTFTLDQYLSSNCSTLTSSGFAGYLQIFLERIDSTHYTLFIQITNTAHPSSGSLFQQTLTVSAADSCCQPITFNANDNTAFVCDCIHAGATITGKNGSCVATPCA